MALYSKYRPSGFDQVVGQEVVVRALRSGLDDGRLAHALLLSGPHGIGKTTLARLIAQGLLCDNGPTGTPCLECDSCKACQADNHPDLLEIDAASNRGVDDARALRERLGMAPMRGKCHVIIIDEAHMLTREAQNALLKALEEPPAEVHFIFATTAAGKVLPTIRSRCQHFSLQRPNGEQIMEALGRAAGGEGIKITPEALAAVAGVAAGSFRDALTLLDQVYSGAGEEEIDADMVYALAGLPGPQAWADLVGAVAEGDAARILNLFQELSQAGYDLRETLGDLAGFLRMILYAQQTGSVPAALAIHPLANSEAQRLAKELSPDKLFQLIGVVENAYAQAGVGGSAAWILETGFSAAALGQTTGIPPQRQTSSPAKPQPKPVATATATASVDETEKLLSTPANKQRLEESIEQAKPSPTPEAKPADKPEPEATPAPEDKPEAKPESEATPAPEDKLEAKPEPEAQPKKEKKIEASEPVELPGPAVAAAAFPMMRLALRENHPEVYLAVRTAWSRYEEGRMILQLPDPLSKQQEKEVLSVIRRMVDGSVKITSRPKAKAAAKPRAQKTGGAPAKPSADPAELLAQFGLTPLDGDKPESA